MRAIKYRAWDKRDNKMREVDSINFSARVADLRMNPGIHDLVFPEQCEVMQFTGLLDKNDKEIYEGDILNYVGFNNKVHRGKVEFYNGAFILRHATGYSPFLHSAGKNDEVIGNIYENPELLK